MTPITNAHTHLELTNLAHLCPVEPMSFVAWMSRLVWHLRRRSKAQIETAIGQGIAELKGCGTTHVGDITNTWLSVEPLLVSGLHGIVYLEILGNDKYRALQRLEEAKRNIDKTRRHPNYGMMQAGLAIHAPYSSIQICCGREPNGVGLKMSPSAFTWPSLRLKPSCY